MEPLYSNLDTGKSEIRLLRLTPGNPLCCRLEAFTLGQCPEYFALSYRWQTEAGQQKVKINGISFQVKVNVFDFLSLFAIDLSSTWLFIDAICVNQADIEEKSQQVALMGEVYRQADIVVIWLGSIDKGYFKSALDDGWQILLDEARCLPHESNNDWTARLQSLFEPRDGRSSMHGICSYLIRNEYWSRLWIVQEVLLARKLQIRFGTLSTDASTLYRIGICADTGMVLQTLTAEASALESAHSNILSFGPEFTSRMQAMRLLHDYHVRSIGDWSLTSALTASHGQQCSDRHDMVYGLLGLTKTSLQVDYNKSIAEVWISALIQALTEIWLSEGSELVPGLRSVEVVFAIRRAFNLQYHDPATFLAIDTIARWFSTSAEALHVPTTYKDERLQRQRTLRLWNFWIPFAVSRSAARAKLTRFRLRKARKKKSRLWLCNSPEDILTYQSIVSWIERIHEDLVQRRSQVENR